MIKIISNSDELDEILGLWNTMKNSDAPVMASSQFVLYDDNVPDGFEDDDYSVAVRYYLIGTGKHLCFLVNREIWDFCEGGREKVMDRIREIARSILS